MDYLHDFDLDLQAAVEACQARIASYPEEFRAEALRYFERNNFFRTDFKGNCLSYLLPFWLQTAFPVDRETCRQIVAGNIFGFLYFLIQDAVMDALPGEYKGNLLPAGNLFYLDSLAQYQRLLPGDSPFWSHLNQYFREWAVSVIREKQGYWLQHKDDQQPELVQLAHKAAPLKICTAAICVLSGNETAVQSLAGLIDATVVTFQLLDDWKDWREDLAAGNCSYFLSQVMRLSNIGELSALEETHIQTAVYRSNIWDQLLLIAERNHSLLQTGSVPHVPYLIAYHQDLLNIFRRISDKAQEQKQVMLKGGLYYQLHYHRKGD